MGGPGIFKARDDVANTTDADDTTGRFLSTDYSDSANNLDREEAHFEAGAAPRNAVVGTSAAFAPYTDKRWSIAFLVNVCVTVIAALYFRASVGHAVDSNKRRLTADGDESFAGGLVSMLLVLTVMVLLAWGLAWGALHSLVSCPNRILQVPYVGFIAFWALATVAVLRSGQYPIAAISAALCAIFLWFFVKRQSRIRFGAANLKVAALAVKSMPGTIRIALFMSLVQVVWFMASSTAAVGSITAFSKVVAPDGTIYSASECQDRADYAGGEAGPSGGGGGGVLVSCECDSVQVSDSPCEYGSARWVLGCFWLASVTWGIFVLKNVVTATVTGSVASWWFSPADQSAVNGAFYRATHGSFGSLCKAAAVIAVVRVVMYPVRRIWFLRRIVSRLFAAVGYGLSYAVCFISIYGLSFSEALRRVGQLFRPRGLILILNDVVVGFGLGLLVLGMTLTYLAAMLLVAVVFIDFSPSSALGGWAFLFAVLFLVPIAMLFSITVEVVRSSHKAVVVCFVQDAEALRANHDGQTYGDLSEAWQKMQAEFPQMVSSDHPHTQIECTEVTSTGVPYAQRIESPGTAAASGGAARGVVQV